MKINSETKSPSQPVEAEDQYRNSRTLGRSLKDVSHVTSLG